MSTQPPITQQRAQVVMGVLCSIEACGALDVPADPNVIVSAIAAAFAVMREVEQCMHPTHDGSDLALLNRTPHEQVKIDPAVWEVLSLSQKIFQLSNGMFDPCLPIRSGTLRDLEILPNSMAICHAPVALDLGGIAKGYAIDRAIAVLRDAKCSSGLVNAGGDLRVFGEQPQRVFIKSKNELPIALDLHNSALAVSELNSGNRPSEHQGYYLRHNHRDAMRTHVAVLAEQAAIADALTKCALFSSAADNEILFAALNARELLL